MLRNIPKIFFLLILFLLPFSLNAKSKETKSQAILKREINFVIKKSNAPRTIKAINIYSRKNKKNIYDFNSGFLLNPASNLKIVTSSFALQNLGINFQFKTVFAYSGVREGDTIDGELSIRTDGDPLISHRDLDSVAKVISQSGIKMIDGNLIVDVSKFDSIEWSPGWMWDDEPSSYQMFVSPACLDYNTIRVYVYLDSARHKLDIVTDPATEFIRTRSTAILDTTDSLFVTRVMVNDTNTIWVSGKFSPYCLPAEYTFSVRQPAQYFGTVFKEMLWKHGIGFNGKILIVHSFGDKTGIILDTLFTLAHSIDTVVTYIDKVSDNLGAECLLRIVPNAIYRQVGSVDSGVKLEKGFLEQCGIDSTEFNIVDGSGLSRYNLITAEELVKILDYDLDQPYGNLFLHSLPVGGIDGTLAKRMRQEFIKGKVIAKTGSIDGVSTLSGYIFLPKDTLVFSMMMQNFLGDEDSIRAVQDSICSILASYDDNSLKFKRNLIRCDVGTYWLINQRREALRREREMRRIRRKKHVAD